MHIYSVGGFVRDMLLRREGFDIPQNGDRDWVVVGTTPEQMLKKGFQPVGADFPVFLHPVTHEEYALARTERKTAPGYHGFVFHTAPSITLEEDLRRRDLTINAIAMDENGVITDPFNGRRDISQRILRHVSDAFAEDPVRILRVARFAARFPSFSIAPETMVLMQQMVQSGEADSLVAERVWAEWYRAMSSIAPLRFIDTLIECGFWDRLLNNLPPPPKNIREALKRSVQYGLPAESRIAILLTSCPSPNAVKKLCNSLRMPSKTAQLCVIFHSVSPMIDKVRSPELAAKLFEQADVLRRPDRMRNMIRMAEAMNNRTYSTLIDAMNAWLSLDAGLIAKEIECPQNIPQAIRKARLSLLSNVDFSPLSATH